MNRLQDKVIAVTGGALGIGRACVERASEEDAAVAVLDMLDTEGRTLVAALQAQGRRAAYWHCDVSREAEVQAALDAAAAHFGALHGLVNNAGIIRPAMIDKMTDQQWQEVIDVHLTGSFYWMRATGRHMVERSKGGERTGTVL